MSITGIGKFTRESKNYSKFAREYILEKLGTHSFQREEITFSFKEPTKCEGEAQVNVRKGKQIIIYEFKTEGTIECESDSDNCEAKYRIDDLNQGLDFEVDSISVTGTSDFHSKCRRLLKKCLLDEIIKATRGLSEEIKNREADPSKLAQDEAQRKQHDEKYKEVVATTSHEKEQLLEQQKQADRENRRI